MADALRTLLAEFLVTVDPQGNLAKGDAAVSKLKGDTEKLEQAFNALKAAAAPAAKVVEDVFTRALRTADRNLQAINAAAFGGRARGSEGGFAAAGLVKAKAEADAASRSFGVRLRRAFDRARVGAAGLTARLRGSGNSLLGGLTAARAGVIGLAAIATGAFARSTLGALQTVGAIDEMAARLNLSTDSFQRLKVLAAQNATSVEALGASFTQLNRVAVFQTTQSAAAFKELGVSVKGANGEVKDSETLFFETLRALAGVENVTRRAALGQVVLGEGAKQLAPIMAKGAAAVDEQREALAKMAVVSQENIQMASDFSDRLDVVKQEVLSKILPALLRMIPAFEALFGIASKAAGIIGNGAKALERWQAQSAGAAGAARLLKGALDLLLLPLKLLEDFIVFLAGGDSVLGEALESAFGTDSPALNTIRAFFDGIFGGFGELAAFLAGETTWEDFADRFIRVTADMTEAIDRWLERLTNLPIIGGLLSGAGKVVSGDVSGGVLQLARSATGTDSGTLERTGNIFGAIKDAIVAAPTIGVPALAGTATPSITDQRTQSVTVNVGSTAEVAGAVQGAQRGMGRDAAANLAAVSG